MDAKVIVKDVDLAVPVHVLVALKIVQTAACLAVSIVVLNMMVVRMTHVRGVLADD